MDLPICKNRGLPFFAYGSFKPGELAYRRIETFLEDEPVHATAQGSLWTRDGLPLLLNDGIGTVSGYLLRFRKECSEDAYQAISDYEPRQYYKWRRKTLRNPILPANLLVLTDSNFAQIEVESGTWSFTRDPLFTEAMKLVLEISRRSGRKQFASAPPEKFDWRRMFRLQMAYLLLWSILERYASLCFGPTLDPEDKVGDLGGTQEFSKAFKSVEIGTRTVTDARNPGSELSLDPRDSRRSLVYYRQVRHNLVHRGKSAWNDGETLRRSLSELGQITQIMLADRFKSSIQTTSTPISRA